MDKIERSFLTIKFKALINGKEYPLWEDLVTNSDKWVGGTLQDYGDEMDWYLELVDQALVTKIKEVNLRPNGDTSAFFEIVGEDFSCGFDVNYGGLTEGEPGWLTFEGFGGHKFRIKKPE